MATATMEIDMMGRPVGKVRNAVSVILLMIFTLGIYGIVYYYCTFEEMRNWRGQGWSGVLFLLFMLLFGIPLIAIPWLIPAYVGRMYEEAGKDKPITGLAGFWWLVPVVGGIVWVVRVQNSLNAFWQAACSRKVETRLPAAESPSVRALPRADEGPALAPAPEG